MKFYEFGNCYFYNSEKTIEQSKENTLIGYSEEMHLGIWLTGNRISVNWSHADEASSVFELKAYIENIFSRVGIKDKFHIAEINNETLSHALQYTTRGEKKIGELGIVSKKVLEKLDIDTDVYFAELNWSFLMKEAKKNKVTFSEISKFPSVKRDLALLLDNHISFSDVKKIASSVEKKLLTEICLFDVYEGKHLPAGKKSYAVSFILQDNEKTLTDKQIDAVVQKIRMALEKELGAQLR